MGARAQAPPYPASFIAAARCLAAGLDTATGRPIVLANGRRFWGESGGDPRAGNELYRGLYGFGADAWRRAGGRGDPADASAAEQTWRLWRLFHLDGRSFREWPYTARVCGLKVTA